MEQTTEENKEISLLESLKILFGASRGFWLVNMVNFGDGIAYFGVLTLLTRFLGTRVGLTDAWTGFSVSCFTGLVTLAMFGGGFVSDKLGVRRALTFSVGLLLAGRLFLTYSPLPGGNSAFLLSWIGLFLMGIGSGVLQPALYAGTKEYTDPRTATIGYSILYAIMNLGIVAENFVSPFVRTDELFIDLKFTKIYGLGWGIDGVFKFCTVITLIMLVVNLLFFTKRVEETQRVTKEVEKPADEKPKTWGETLAELPFLDKRFMFFIFILLPVRTLFAHQFLTIPDYVFRAFPEEVGAKFEWINGLNPLIIVVFVPLIAAMTRKANVINMMIIGTTISALTTFILVPGPNLWTLIIYVTLFSFGEAVWSSRFLEYVANLAPAGKVGAYMGLAGIPWFLAKFTTGLYSGFMLEKFIPEVGISAYWAKSIESATHLVSGGDSILNYGLVFIPNLVSQISSEIFSGSHLSTIFSVQNTSTLWLIYGIFACISPIGLILGKRWVEVGHKPANDNA
ncbi:MAG: MFS transporter [Candidatus Riflebacteria bacterium]|nr:MFS transporter [Candidatus Riflebacteria bacterium]